MVNLSEDIQYAGFDTHPPMHIGLTLHHGNNIFDCIVGETLAEGNKGALHLGPERARVYSDISPEDKDRYNDDIRATNILLQGLPKDIYILINHYIVKLNIGLRDSNYDQLYAYLKQHEAHANENKMILEQFTQPNVDPLALMSNVLHQQYYSQSSTTLPSTHLQPHFADNTQLDSGLFQQTTYLRT
ncbi:hypothetical protein Tco_0492078 [Tanacetum coccineum]